MEWVLTERFIQHLLSAHLGKESNNPAPKDHTVQCERQASWQLSASEFRTSQWKGLTGAGGTGWSRGGHSRRQGAGHVIQVLKDE